VLLAGVDVDGAPEPLAAGLLLLLPLSSPPQAESAAVSAKTVEMAHASVTRFNIAELIILILSIR
jgi:hypothetical protein